MSNRYRNIAIAHLVSEEKTISGLIRTRTSRPRPTQSTKLQTASFLNLRQSDGEDNKNPRNPKGNCASVAYIQVTPIPNSLYNCRDKAAEDRAKVKKYFDDGRLFARTIGVDLRGVEDSSGILSVRTVNPHRVKQLMESFRFSDFGAAKVMIVDTGCESKWEEYDIRDGEPEGYIQYKLNE